MIKRCLLTLISDLREGGTQRHSLHHHGVGRYDTTLKVWRTVMDGDQTVIFKAGCRPVTSWANAAWMPTEFHTLWSTDLRKTSKLGAAKCHFLRLKCTKFDFCWALSQTPVVEPTVFSRSPGEGCLLIGEFASVEKGREGNLGWSVQAFFHFEHY